MKFSYNFKEISAILVWEPVSMIFLWNFEQTTSVVDISKVFPQLSEG